MGKRQAEVGERCGREGAWCGAYPDSSCSALLAANNVCAPELDANKAASLHMSSACITAAKSPAAAAVREQLARSNAALSAAY